MPNLSNSIYSARWSCAHSANFQTLSAQACHIRWLLVCLTGKERDQSSCDVSFNCCSQSIASQSILVFCSHWHRSERKAQKNSSLETTGNCQRQSDAAQVDVPWHQRYEFVCFHKLLAFAHISFSHLPIFQYPHRLPPCRLWRGFLTPSPEQPLQQSKQPRMRIPIEISLNMNDLFL